MDDTEDERYMRRCIQLAMNSPRTTSPNPMVGAVIVHDGRIIGEGYHIRRGEGHAEVNAINSVNDDTLLKDSTIYVSLEPCSHYGKTPPCADLIISKHISRVVVGCVDPFAKVHGQGIKKLRDAGIDVTVGVLGDECKALNKKFMTSQMKHRPYIILKWAVSADGFIDNERNGGNPVVLSTSHTSILVHKLRAENDAIMVGTHTALLDNPKLTVRNWYGLNPTRIVIDRNLSLPQKLYLFDGQAPTLVYTEKIHDDIYNVQYIKLEPTENLLPQIIADLAERNTSSLLVEGGRRLLQSFIDGGLWDEAYVEHSILLLESGVKEPQINGLKDTQFMFGVEISHYTQK